MRFITWAGWLRLGIAGVVVGSVAWILGCRMMSFPGESWTEPLPAPIDPVKETAAVLRRHVDTLATRIGTRNTTFPDGLAAARDWIEKEFRSYGYKTARQTFTVRDVECSNIEVEIRGAKTPDEIVVIGGHYDTCYTTPGANDNATGTAGVLELARFFRKPPKPLDRTLRFVCFVNEEPPDFQTENMGSLVYAKRCAERKEKIVAMLSLETMGYFSDEEGSQQYPPGFASFYPSTGNFIGFVGNLSSRPLVAQCVETFRATAKFPCEGAALPGFITGVGWSDHWAFWEAGYSGVMVTDTAPFRYPWYHDDEDTPDKIDFDRFARVVVGLRAVVTTLASEVEGGAGEKGKKSEESTKSEKIGETKDASEAAEDGAGETGETGEKAGGAKNAKEPVGDT